jgi:hypothetical protein
MANGRHSLDFIGFSRGFRMSSIRMLKFHCKMSVTNIRGMRRGIVLMPWRHRDPATRQIGGIGFWFAYKFAISANPGS